VFTAKLWRIDDNKYRSFLRWTWTQHFGSTEDLWDTFFYTGDPDVIMSWPTCSMLPVLQQLGTSLAGSLAWLHGRRYFSIPTCMTKALQEGALERPAKTQTSIRLASHLVRGPNSKYIVRILCLDMSPASLKTYSRRPMTYNIHLKTYMLFPYVWTICV
jgi:hypothetical protein